MDDCKCADFAECAGPCVQKTQYVRLSLFARDLLGTFRATKWGLKWADERGVRRKREQFDCERMLVFIREAGAGGKGSRRGEAAARGLLEGGVAHPAPCESGIYCGRRSIEQRLSND